MGPGQECRLGAVAMGQRKAQPGGAQVCQGEKHPKACKLLLSAFFHSSCLGEKKKKKQRFLWRRMQKGCRILTISCTRGFPGGVWAPAWHGGVTGRDWPECLRPLSGTHWRARPSRHHHPEAGPEAGVRGPEVRGTQGPHRAGIWWSTGHHNSHL